MKRGISPVDLFLFFFCKRWPPSDKFERIETPHTVLNGTKSDPFHRLAVSRIEDKKGQNPLFSGE